MQLFYFNAAGPNFTEINETASLLMDFPIPLGVRFSIDVLNERLP